MALLSPTSRQPREPLKAAASGDPVALALDEMDERHERRHAEAQRTTLTIVGGLATGLVTVCLVAMFLVGESRGVDSGKVAEAAGRLGSNETRATGVMSAEAAEPAPPDAGDPDGDGEEDLPLDHDVVLPRRDP
jgi:hypothetical protein